MTLCLIILILFYIVEVILSNKIGIKAKEYDKRRITNPILQYDTSCSIIKEMANNYRYYVSTLSFEDFFEEDYLKRIEDITELEHKWICCVLDIYNLSIDNVSLKLIYGEGGIWYAIPLTYSKEFFINWKEKNNSSYSDQTTSRKLKKIIELKNLILSDKDNNSYSGYKNKTAIDYVAKKFGLPSNEEYKKLYCKPYESIAHLCRVYMRRFAKQNNFKYIPLNMICENPTEEQKQIQYQKTSEDEQTFKGIKDQSEIIKKYDL